MVASRLQVGCVANADDGGVQVISSRRRWAYKYCTRVLCLVAFALGCGADAFEVEMIGLLGLED